MPLSPEDVVRKVFRTRLRGYDPDEVDAFLEEVVAELQRLGAQVNELLAAESGQSRRSLDRASFESGQLALVRQERRALVDEMAVLQDRLDSMKQAISSAEGPHAVGDVHAP